MTVSVETLETFPITNSEIKQWKSFFGANVIKKVLYYCQIRYIIKTNVKEIKKVSIIRYSRVITNH